MFVTANLTPEQISDLVNNKPIMIKTNQICTQNKKDVRKQHEKVQAAPFEHIVDMKKNSTAASGQREVYRSWFQSNNILTYQTWGEKAEVMWDKNWRKFYFKDLKIATLFALKFG